MRRIGYRSDDLDVARFGLDAAVIGSHAKRSYSYAFGMHRLDGLGRPSSGPIPKAQAATLSPRGIAQALPQPPSYRANERALFARFEFDQVDQAHVDVLPAAGLVAMHG